LHYEYERLFGVKLFITDMTILWVSVDNLWITLLQAISEQTNGKAKGCSMSSVKRFMTVWQKMVTYAEVAEK